MQRNVVNASVSLGAPLLLQVYCTVQGNLCAALALRAPEFQLKR